MLDIGLCFKNRKKTPHRELHAHAEVYLMR